ncbi:DUF6270 domain-containing protein [Neobacillus vireti]|uniref:DUF6270 domain-containing protein n=1 Tax=Neobacillus vireti TaxID=220686 RepID=UPI002FFFE7A7
MRVIISSIDFTNGVFGFKGRAETALDENSALCVRRREDEHGLEYPEEFTYPLTVDGNQFSFEMDINALYAGVSLHNDVVWDLFILNQDDYFKLEAPPSLNYSADYQILDNKLFKAKPYITGVKGVSIYILQNSIQGLVESALFEFGVFDLSVLVENNAFTEEDSWGEYRVQLVAKKREQEQLFEYYESKIIEPISGSNPFQFSIDVNSFFEEVSLKKNLVWDLFVEVNSKEGLVVEVPLMCTNQTKQLYNFNYFNFSHNDLFRVKPYVTGKNNFAFFVRSNEINVNFTDLQFENNVIRVEGSISSREYEVLNLNAVDSYLVFKKRTTIGKQFEYFTEKVIPLPILNNYFKAELSVSEFFKEEVIRQGDVWDIFLRVTTMDGKKMDVTAAPSVEIKKVNFEYEVLESNPTVRFKPYVNGQGTYSFFFIDANKRQKDAVNVAVLGSCFSRNPFNSSNYFNPGYKKNYNVVLTQFHSSLISIMAKPFQLDVTKLEDVSDYNKQFIVADFEKSFFEMLEQTKPEYLIVDLYADAARDVIKIDEETYVSASIALRQSKYFKEFVEYEVVSHANNDKYFALWKKHMDLFADKIKEYLPEDRIILNLGGFTNRYHDGDGTIKKFPKEHMIQRNNYFWDRLNAYFLERIPNCEIMNLKDTKFIGQHDHPFGNTFSHYQSGYYKEFMNRLNKMVLKDLQEERYQHKQ